MDVQVENKYKDNMNCAERAVKRLFDVVGAGVALMAVSPFALLIALRIRMDEKGSVIYRQERIGYGGRPFYMYKFRSMRHDAEAADLPQLCKENDERLTPFGIFLREHHLDEIPQLWNILRGDMSFVGPRPERKYFVDVILRHNPDYRYLYRLRPGIFSRATLYNGYTDTVEKMLVRLEMDLDYLVTRTFWGDLKIIGLTVFNILSGKKF